VPDGNKPEIMSEVCIRRLTPVFLAKYTTGKFKVTFAMMVSERVPVFIQ